MRDDLFEVWESFEVDLNAEIKSIGTATSQTFDEIGKIASYTQQNESSAAKHTKRAMWTFASNLHHRKQITQEAIVRASETFNKNLSSLRTDALSPIKTAFIGRLMDDTYRAANMKSGKPIIIITKAT
jgi:hypothetical protein